ncbi:MAG: DUF4124 domain-containing protein [Pseudomonadaceae bacterium]|nr:DUF4124 domain-containing protein [Pseudomonadaceae bacterium]
MYAISLNPDRHLLLALLLVIAAGLTWAPSAYSAIYKTTDADGNVVFTDVPPKDDAKSFELTEGNTYRPETPVPAIPAPVDVDETQETEESAEEAPRAGYDKIAITAPADDEALRENTGNISVSVSMDPALDTSSGHRIQVLVDGQVAGEAPSATVSLQNIDRGTHSLVAQVVDANNNVLASSSAVVVHLQRYSILNAPGK